jgi:hypothetical protein
VVDYGRTHGKARSHARDFLGWVFTRVAIRWVDGGGLASSYSKSVDKSVGF